MSIPPVLNHYRILQPLGRGGMGEVFAAEDTRLHRKVAVKVLSALMAGDPERRQRFEREARAIAALNHPNIVTIHSVEEADGIPFLTMELVEGRTLGELIPSGGLPLDALLRVGIAVSEAMAAAHQRGITHRDLKPGNVMVLPDGRVKVLDFGLAKLREAELDGGAMTRMPTTDLTGEGRIIGTVAYMSPEQAEGKPVDQRSDIFSLGVIMHEMATGERPFKGDTNVSVISSILKDTPSAITDLNPTLPTELSKIIRRALAKDPERRFQTATDLRNELEELKQEIDSGVTVAVPAGAARPAPPGFRTTRVAGAVLAVALVAAAFAFAWWSARRAAAPAFEAERFTRLTATGNAQNAAISADGRYVVHVKNQQFRLGLWVRQTATASDVQIVPPAEVRYDGVTFSPDGNYVYYVTYELTGGVGTLFRIPVLGGTPLRVVDDIDSAPTFSPDGRRLGFLRGDPAAGRNYVMVANSDGSTARQLGSVEPPDQLQLNAVSWSPDGRTILTTFQSLREGPHNGCMAIDAETGVAQSVCGRWTAVNDVTWMPDGRSFLASAVEFGGFTPQLWQVSYPSGERRRITNDLNNYIGVSVSADGRSIATVQAENISNIWVMPADASAPGSQTTTGRGRGDGLSGISWTPDGRIVFSSTASGAPQIWIMNADGTGQVQLTNDDRPSLAPAVSGDGRYAIFQRIAEDGIFLHRVSLDGSGTTPLTASGADFAPVASRDGRWVYYYSPASGAPRPFKIPIDGGQPTSLGDVYFRPVAVSPDDTRLLGTSWDEKQRRSTLATLPVNGGVPTLLGLPAIAIASWSPDGQSVVYVDAQGGVLNLWSRALDGGTPRKLTNFTSDIVFWFAFSRDGTRLALARGTGSSDVVVIARK